MDGDVTSLMSYRRFLESAGQSWPRFLGKRQERLVQWERNGRVAEKVAESILEDLFTLVLDWPLANVNNQVAYADLVLTDLGVKHLIIEAKRPGSLQWSRGAVDEALDQARRYGGEQRVRSIAVSDGLLFYAADLAHGGLRDRVFVRLTAQSLPEALWWVSRHGIYRPSPPDVRVCFDRVDADSMNTGPFQSATEPPLLHPKYQLSCRCFAYAGDPSRPNTWKLPYLLADGSVDAKRLPKAIQCILTNYRGARVSDIPEAAIPDVLVRLAQAAARLGRMPAQQTETAEIYRHLAAILEQFGRLADVRRDD